MMSGLAQRIGHSRRVEQRRPWARTRGPVTLVATLAVCVGSWAGAGAAGAQGSTRPGPATATLTVSGRVQQIVIDSRPGAARETGPMRTMPLVDVGGRLLAPPAGQLTEARPGQPVTLTLRAPARFSARQAVAAVSGVSVISAIAAPGKAIVAGTTTGAHTVTILPVYWSSPDSQTQTTLAALGSQMHDYWAAQSGGAVDLQVTTRDWKKVADPGGCNPTALYTSALAAHGISAPANVNQHVVIYFPNRSDCQWAGLGSVLGSTIWDNGYPLIDVFTHEFGHNLGLGHANAATCTASGSSARVPWSSSCTVAPYHDTADVMGFAEYLPSGTLNSAFAEYLGLAQVTTASASSTTTVDISPLQQTSAMRAVRIPISGGDIFVEYRPAVAPDTREPNWGGVQARFRPSGSYPATQLIDLQPDRSSAFDRANLPTYATWAAPGTGLAVRVNSVGYSAANITVAPTGGDTTAPAAVTPITPAGGGRLGTGGLVSWPSSTDSGSSGGAAAGVSDYVLFLDGKPTTVPTVVDASANSVALPLGLSTGTHTVRVDVSDKAGNTAAGTTVSFTETGAAPDGVPTIISPAGGLVTKTAPAVGWTLSTPSAAAVVLDGTVQGTVTSAVTSYALSGLADGAHAVVVRALDGSGATTGTSASVSFTLDTAAPSAPASITYTAGRLTWTASIDATSGISGYAVTVDGTNAGTSATNSLAVSLAAGTHTVVVMASDRVGNTAGGMQAVKVADSTAPTAPSISAPAAASILGGSTVVRWTAAGDAETGIAGYTVNVNGSAAASASGGATSATVSLSDGKASITVTAVNGDGLSTTSAPVAVVIDTIAPAAVTKVALTGDGSKLTWSAPSDSGTKRHYLVTLDGGSATSVDTTSAALALAPGRHTFAVVAVDQAGNAGPATTLTAWFDPTPPGAVTITAPAAGAYLSHRATTLTWQAGSDSDTGLLGYRLTLNGKVIASQLDASATSQDLSLAEGKNTATVAAINNAGKVGAAGSVVFYADTASPAAPKNLRLSQDGSLLSWTGASAAGSPVSYAVSVDSAEPTAVSEPRISLTTAIGQHTFAVTARDAAGNTSATASLTLWFDPTAPTSPKITAPTEGSYVTSLPATLTWIAASDSDGGVAGYRVAVDGKALDAKTVGALGTSSRSAEVKLGQGQHTLSVAAVNNAGLAGAASSVTVTVDTNAPATPSAPVLSADRTTLSWKASKDKGKAVVFLVSTDGGTASVDSDTSWALAGTTVARHTWSVTARDAAGNLSGTVSVTGWYDTSAPSPPTITSPVADAVTNSTTVIWSGGADPQSGLAGFLINVNGTASKALAGPGDTSVTIKPKDGAVTVTVAAVNNAGLVSTVAARSFILDRSAPKAPKSVTVPVTLAEGQPDALVWAASTDAVSGVAGYVLYLDGIQMSRTSGDATAADVTPSSGRHYWSVAAFDAAGNLSKQTRSAYFYRDGSAPSAPVLLSPASGSATTNHAVTVKWAPAGDLETGVTRYLLTVSGATSKALNLGASARSATVTFGDGESTITLVAMDGAGLTSSAANATITVSTGSGTRAR